MTRSTISSDIASSVPPNSLADLVTPPEGWDFDRYVLSPRWGVRPNAMHQQALELYLEFVRRCSLD